MASGRWDVLVLVFVNIISLPSLKAHVLCPEDVNVFESVNNVTCRVDPNNVLCLLCPIPQTVNVSKWNRGHKSIYRLGHNTGAEEIYIINKCNSTFNSLKLTEIAIDQHRKVFSCIPGEPVNTTYSYTVEIKANAVSHIEETFDGTILKDTFISNRRDLTLKCIVKNAIGNVTLTWTVNGSEESSQKLYQDDHPDGTYTSIYNYVNTGVPENVTCTSSGDNIKDGSVWCVVQTSIQDSTGAFIVMIVISIVLLASTGAITVLYLFKRKHSRQASKSLSISGDSSRNSDEKIVASTEQSVPSYAQVAPKQHLSKELNDLTNIVIMEEQIKGTSKFDYWRGTWLGSPPEEKPCFVKTLNDKNTLRNAYEFKRLAETVSALPAHAHVVTVLSIYIEEVPYSIYYEYMPFGTLREILITRYRLEASSRISKVTTATPPIDLKSETELVSFACDIAEAMTYITAQKYSHPVLSTRKVLLTERGRCKLYDIYPTEMAIFKIDEVMSRECPPVAWLAPETIFMKEYSCASDLWNFAVVLWEIFSLGDIPDKGMSQTQVEKNIKQFVHLHRPPCCPEDIYSLMLSCWVTSTRDRPTFEDIKIQLFNLIKS